MFEEYAHACKYLRDVLLPLDQRVQMGLADVNDVLDLYGAIISLEMDIGDEIETVEGILNVPGQDIAYQVSECYISDSLEIKRSCFFGASNTLLELIDHEREMAYSFDLRGDEVVSFQTRYFGSDRE